MAADTDILTPQEARAAANVNSDPLADELAIFVSGLSEAIDDACGPIVQREMTERFDHPCRGPLLLSRTPVLEVVSVTEVNGPTSTALLPEQPGEDPPVYPSSSWRLHANRHHAELYHRSGGYDAWWTGYPVEVTTISGRCDSTATAPRRFKDTALQILAIEWPLYAARWARSQDFTDDIEAPGGFDRDAFIRSKLVRDLLPSGIT